jgi:hypothetical protein
MVWIDEVGVEQARPSPVEHVTAMLDLAMVGRSSTNAVG